MSKIKLNSLAKGRRFAALFVRRDPLFGSWFVLKLANCLPQKSNARNLKLLYAAMAQFKARYGVHPALALVFSCFVCRPVIGIKNRKYGVKVFKTPYGITPNRQYKRALK